MRKAKTIKNNADRIEEFGRHLRRLRETAGMSQNDLADAAYLAKTSIQSIENAKSAATLDTLITLANALEIPLKDLMDF